MALVVPGQNSSSWIPVRAAVRSRAPPALPSQYYMYYNSTKIPQLPSPPYAPSYAPQSALAHLRLCPPSTTIVLPLSFPRRRTRRRTRRSPLTFVLKFNENPSAVRAVNRAAVRSLQRKSLRRTRRRACRSPLSRPSGFVLQYYMCTTIQRKPLRRTRRRTRHRRTCRSPLSRSSGSILQYYICTIQFNENPSAVRAVVRAAVRSFVLQINENPSAARAVVRAAVRSRAPPALSSSTTFVLQFNENPSAIRAVVRAAVPLSRPSGSVLQYYICTTIQAKSLRRTRRRTRRRTCRSPLSRPSGSVLQYFICTTTQRKSLRRTPRRPRRRTCRSPLSRPSGSVLRLYYNSTKVPPPYAPSYAPSYVPQSALAPLRLCPRVLHVYYTIQRKSLRRTRRRTRRACVPLSALAPLRLCPPALHLYYNSSKIPPRTRRRTCRSPLSPPSGSVLQDYICTTIHRKSLRHTRRRTSNTLSPRGSDLPASFIPVSFLSPFRFHPAPPFPGIVLSRFEPKQEPNIRDVFGRKRASKGPQPFSIFVSAAFAMLGLLGVANTWQG